MEFVEDSLPHGDTAKKPVFFETLGQASKQRFILHHWNTDYLLGHARRTMPLVFTYLFAAAGAWCLFYPYGFVWPLPALFIALLAYVTRTVRAATWVLLVFSGLLAVWSGWTFRRALDPEQDMGSFALWLTPCLQVLAIALVLGPVLASVCWFFGAARSNHPLQRTGTSDGAASDLRE